MKTPAQLMRTLLGGAIIASGLTAVVAVAGPVPGAAAAVTTPSKVISVQRNAALGAFLTEGGDIYTYGDNSAGATGLGLTSGVTETPVKLASFAPSGEKVVQISLSGTGSLSIASGIGLALTDGGHVYSWGYDGQGGLGNDAALTNQSTPVAVSPTWGSDEPVYVASIAGGGRVVTESGRVYAWGYNEWGQTGVDNGGGNITTPVEVTSLNRPTDKVVQIVGGTSSMLVRTASGAVFAAGTKARGQRGDNTTDPNGYNTYTPALGQPSFTGLPTGDSIVSIGSGTSYAFAVSGTGKVWGWGFGQSGRLGDGLGTHDQLTPLPITPTMVDSGDKIASVEIGGSGNTSMLLSAQGHLYTVGSGNNGMLGNGATTNTTTFGKITSWPGRAANDPIVDAVMGSSNALAVTQSGAVYTWGNSLVTNQGGIGTGTQNQTGTPPNIVSSPVALAQPVVVSSFTDAVDASITGTVKVGVALTASAGTYAPSDASLAYEWKIGSDTVSTTSSYTPKLADAGSDLTLTVTGSKSGYTNSVSTTTAQAVATAQGFTGTVKAGQLLTADDPTGSNTWIITTSSSCVPQASSASGTTLRLNTNTGGRYVQLWQTLSGRTGKGSCVGPIADYTLPPSLDGATTASGTKGEPFSYDMNQYGPGVPRATFSVVGALPAGVTVRSNEWGLSGTPTEAGTFAVTLKADNGVTTAATLPLTITIDDLVSGLAPTISGTPKVGAQLTASPGGSLAPSAADGATVAYLWQHESSPGEWSDLTAGSTYTPDASEMGRVYRVKVTVSKAGFKTRTEYSSATAAVKGTFTIDPPSISGTAKVGQTLTCEAANGTPGTLSYAWTRGSTSLGTDTTHELTAADRTNEVTCTVTSARTGYADATSSTDSETVGYGTFTIDAPAISGSAVVGEELTCVAATGTPGTITYAWTRGTTSLGSGATYELKANDRAEQVTCTVTAVRPGYTDATSSKDSVTVGYGTFAIDAPSISGSAAVGETLTCSAAQGTPGTVSYAWTRGTTPLGSDATYKLTADDRTEVVTCTVTAARAGYTDATSSEDSATVETGSFEIDAPSISGTAAVGETLTCAAADGTPGTVSYAWTRGTTPLGSDATYKLTADDRTEVVTCTVTAARAGYTDATSSKDSATVETGSFEIDAPSITGTAKVGGTLTCAAAPGTPGTVSYAWTRGSTTLSSVATYELTGADRTSVVTCTVTAERAGYADATSELDSEVVDLGTFSIDAPSITGTAKVGGTLTCAAAPGTPGTVSYAWTRGSTTLSSDATHELTADDRGNAVTCTVTAERADYTDATNELDSEIVDFGTFSIDAPTVTGTAKAGQTLTCAAAPGTPDTVAYAWTRGTTSLGSAATYKLTAADSSRDVTCTVTSSRDGYTDAISDITITVDAAPVVKITGLKPRVVGKTAEGAKVTADAGKIAPSSAVRTYQWLANGTKIKGATGRTLKLGKAQAGRKISVQVSAKAGAVQARATSPARMVHSSKHRLVITGKTARGEKITVTATGLTPGRRYVVWLGGQQRAAGVVGRTGTVSRSMTFGSKIDPGVRRVRVSTYKKSGKRASTIVRSVSYR